MLPSIGFFIVAPKSSLQIPHADEMSPDEFESAVADSAEAMGWKYCFSQSMTGEAHLYF